MPGATKVHRTFFTGHEKYDSLYVLERRPGLVILRGGLAPLSFCSLADYEAAKASLILAVRDLVERPELFQQYRPESVQLEPGRWFDVLVRKDVAFPAGTCATAAS